MTGDGVPAGLFGAIDDPSGMDPTEADDGGGGSTHRGETGGLGLSLGLHGAALVRRSRRRAHA